AAVDPAAAARRAVRLQQLVGRERLALVVVAVDLGEDGLGARLLDLPARRVRPRQVEDRPVLRVLCSLRALQLLADRAAEVVVEPELRAAVLLRLGRAEVPLQETLRVREGAVLLEVRAGRQEEDLGADLLRRQFARLDLGAVVPERRRL